MTGYLTIIYGPGDPKLAHVPDVSVGVDHVLEAPRDYALAAPALTETPSQFTLRRRRAL